MKEFFFEIRKLAAQLIDDNLVWTFAARVRFSGVNSSFTM